MTDDNARWLIRKTPEGFAKLGDPARALAREAEPTADVPPVWWWPSLAEFIQEANDPGYTYWSTNQQEWLFVVELPADAVRLVPAGGSAPADEPDIAAQLEAARVSSRHWLGVAGAAHTEFGRMRPVVEAVEALVDEWPTNLPYGPYQRRVVDAVAAYRAGGSAPHQGATTDVTAAAVALADYWREQPASTRDYVENASEPVRDLIDGLVRALLGAGETTEETHG
jgi:hypothetical protein